MMASDHLLVPGRPTVPTTLTQHLEEAAFCWLRRSEALWHPAYNREHFHRLDWLLDAHLEGLRVAGGAAVMPALESLARWKTADEVFVTTYVLLHTPDAAGQEQLETLLAEQHDLVSGAADAMCWAGLNVGLDCIERWRSADSPVLRQAALSAALGLGHEPESSIKAGLDDADPGVRARALRAIGEHGLAGHAARLDTVINDEDNPACRFEATWAQALLGNHTAAAKGLVRTIDALSETAPDHARRRGLMAWAVVADEAAFDHWVQSHMENPELRRDLIWAMAFRGDPVWLPCLTEWAADRQHARLVGYAVSHMTGIDIEEEGLEREPEDEEEDAQTTEDPVESLPAEDDGLPEPDPDRLKTRLDQPGNALPATIRHLAGKPLDTGNARYQLAHGWQPQRWQATFYLASRGELDKSDEPGHNLGVEGQVQ